MLKRGALLPLAALLLLVSTCLVSCSVVTSVDIHEEYPEVNTALTTSLEVSLPEIPSADKNESTDAYNSETQLSYLPEYNCEGKYFIILTLEDNRAVFPDETDYIAASVYKRNALVQEKFNVQLLEKAVSAEALSEYVESSELAGSYYADLICIPAKSVESFYDKGVIDNFDQKPFYVADRPYFDEAITSKLNEGYDGTYALYCDTLVNPDDIYCLFYNKAHEGASSIGAYTADFSESSFLELANEYKTVSQIGSDLFGDSLTLTEEEGKSAEQIFLDGGSLFLVGKLGDLSTLSSKHADLGILPLPKAEDGGFRALSDTDSLYVFCYPSNATLDMRTLLIAMGLGAAGCDYNMDAAKEHYLGYVQDNSSAQMLDLILSDYTVSD